MGQLGVQEAQLQGLRGALRQLQQETEQNCRRELQQMRAQLAGEGWGSGALGKAVGSGLSLTTAFLPPGLRARMASLRQGCGDLRGLVSTFTQSCQGSLSEARGQVRTPRSPPLHLFSVQPRHWPSLGEPLLSLPFQSQGLVSSTANLRFWNQNNCPVQTGVTVNPSQVLLGSLSSIPGPLNDAPRV